MSKVRRCGVLDIKNIDKQLPIEICIKPGRNELIEIIVEVCNANKVTCGVVGLVGDIADKIMELLEGNENTNL